MVNLLPIEEKKEIVSRKKLKLALIFEAGILLFFVSFLLAAFAEGIYFEGEANLQKTFFSQKEKEAEKAAVLNFKKNIEYLNKRLKNIKTSLSDQMLPGPVLEKIYSFLPEGAYLESFSLHNGKINLAGFSPTREKLLSFKDSLEKENSFKNVNFPPINWVKGQDIDFSLTFEIR